MRAEGAPPGKIVQTVGDSSALGAPVTNHREGEIVFRRIDVMECAGEVHDAALSTFSADLNVNPSEAEKAMLACVGCVNVYEGGWGLDRRCGMEEIIDVNGELQGLGRVNIGVEE